MTGLPVDDGQWLWRSQGGDGPCSSKPFVQALLEAMGSPCAPSVSRCSTPDVLYGWQRQFTLQTDLLRMICFLQGELGIPSWLEGSVHSHLSTSGPVCHTCEHSRIWMSDPSVVGLSCHWVGQCSYGLFLSSQKILPDSTDKKYSASLTNCLCISCMHLFSLCVWSPP